MGVRRIFSRGEQIRRSEGRKPASEVHGCSPGEGFEAKPSKRHVLKIMHKYFVHGDFRQQLLVTNALKHSQHFQVEASAPIAHAGAHEQLYRSRLCLRKKVRVQGQIKRRFILGLNPLKLMLFNNN